MKTIKLVAFLLLLISATTNSKACSYYPYGEDIRFSLFSSNIADAEDMEELFFSAQFFNEYSQKELDGPNENLTEWVAYFGGRFDAAVIDELIYQISYKKPDGRMRKNELFQYLKKDGDQATKTYILFAKKVESLLSYDNWSSEYLNVKQGEKALKFALKKHGQVKSDFLKLRYAYQAMVLAYYLNFPDLGLQIYDEKITVNPSESVIKTWSLFYKALMIGDQLESYRLMAIVFESSRAKNPFIHNYFPNDEETAGKVLEICQNNEEKAAVHTVMTFKNPFRALDQLQTIAELDPNSSLLEVLMVREINKLEDWFYTDRYTGMGSAFNSEYYDESFEDIDAKNFESDRYYLLEVFTFATNFIKENPAKNNAFWNTSLAYMSYMLEDAVYTEFHLSQAQSQNPNRVELAEIKTIELLALVKFAEEWDKVFQNDLYARLRELEEFQEEIYNYDRFYGQIMLAISRKFLDEGDLSLAALFETKVSDDTYERYSNWGDNKYQGFDLLNENADPADMEAFFELWNKKDKTNLETYLFEGMEGWKWRFTDLWGTTYLREDRLEEALKIYETIPDSVWKVTNHTYHYYYAQELHDDPFETRFMAPGYGPFGDKTYTKPEFVKEIIRLKKAVQTNAPHKAYNYMLLGNAYYNMSHDGNSWYYSEYAWSVESLYGSSGKNEEYKTANKAINYYKLAEETSKNEAFSAFCYRLQAKCIRMQASLNEGTYRAIETYAEKFLKKYPKHYYNLQGCDEFDAYFEKWKDA